jgi:hypothetical protein
MDLKSYIGPTAAILIAAGGYLTTIEAVADDTKDLQQRVRAVEVAQASEQSTKVVVAQNTERLARLEQMIEKIAESQIKSLQNEARICERLNADCR